MKIPPRRLRVAALVFLLVALAPVVFAAGTNAAIPYKSLDDLFQMTAGIDQAKLAVAVCVTSMKQTVHPADITLTIQTATRGNIPLPIGTNGQLLNFPHREELRRENPFIIANQPKGTLNLSIDIHIPVPEDGAFPYQRLGDGVAEANKAIKAQAGMLSLLAPSAKGVVFLFPKNRAGKATVEVEASAGKKIYTADPEGEVKLKLEKALLKENPRVRISEKPESIAPDVE